MLLITIDEAADHLNIDLAGNEGSPTAITDERYPELLEKMTEASEIVLDYLKTQDSSWTVETIPGSVRAAIKLVLSDLWEHRNGGDGGDWIKPDGPVANLLRRYRDPAIA